MTNKIKAAAAPDPIAAISGGLLTLAGTLGIKERFGIELTADEIAEIIGVVISIGASIRFWWERRKARAVSDASEFERRSRPTGPEFVSGDSDASDEGAR